MLELLLLLLGVVCLNAEDGDGEGLMGDRRERGGMGWDGKGEKGRGVKQGLRMRGVTWGGIGEGGRQKNRSAKLSLKNS